MNLLYLRTKQNDDIVKITMDIKPDNKVDI